MRSPPLNNIFYRWLDQIFFSHETAIIMYHGFTDQKDQLENYHGKHLHVQTFRTHLQYLKEYYSVISLTAFIDHCLLKTPIPRNSVVLTFDDGYESNFILAYPVLKELAVPATIFLSTDFIEQKQFIWPNRIEYAILATRHSSLRLPLKDGEMVFDLRHDEAKKEAIHDIKTLLKPLDTTQRNNLLDTMEHTLEQKLIFNAATPAIHRPLTWQQIKQMAQNSLVEIGAHTCSHAILAQCTPDMMNEEVLISQKVIEDQLKTKCGLFCYPYGGEGTFNDQTKECLQRSGYRCALTTINGKNSAHSDLFTLKRLGTSDLVEMDNFENNLLSARKTLRRFRSKIF
jgi:peptidoglycan/xylan/chitin deacetylase (PgdA/CDA1 family)